MKIFVVPFSAQSEQEVNTNLKLDSARNLQCWLSVTESHQTVVVVVCHQVDDDGGGDGASGGGGGAGD